MKDIKEYLPFYIGAMAEYKSIAGDVNIMNITGHDCDYSHIDKSFYAKPILRPLDSMTEEEKKEIKFELRQDIQAALQKDFQRRSYTAKQFVMLLSKHFDIFNLHDEGLCYYRNEKGELI